MIPRTLHQVWIGPPMPEEFALYMKSWADLHPEWEHVLWDEKTIEALPMLRSNRVLWDDAEKYAAGNGVHQLRADVARYELLYHHGGVYVDADFECKRPIDLLLSRGTLHDRSADETGAFAAWEVEHRWVNNAIMGARALHPLTARLCAGLGANVTRVRRARRSARPNALSGPQYLTRIIKEHAVPVVIFAKELFYPYLYNELDRADDEFPAAYAVHHWHNRRLQEHAR